LVNSFIETKKFDTKQTVENGIYRNNPTDNTDDAIVSILRFGNLSLSA